MKRGETDGSYEVGFRKPPRRTQFQKGRSGNPKGRPRRNISLKHVLKEMLNEQIPISENGQRKKVSKLEVMSKQLVNKAAGGDFRSIKLLLNLIPALHIDFTEPSHPGGLSKETVDAIRRAMLGGLAAAESKERPSTHAASESGPDPAAERTAPPKPSP